MSNPASDFRIKIIIKANPEELERAFNVWVAAGLQNIEGPPQVQYSPALQKFIVSVMYTEHTEEENHAEGSTDERASGGD